MVVLIKLHDDFQVNGVAVGKSFTFSIKFINININPVNNRGLVTINIFEILIKIE